MSIVYVPLLSKPTGVLLEHSMPSELAGKIPAEEWETILHQINSYLHRRSPSFLSRLLSISALGNILNKYLLQRIDAELEQYLEKKNIILKRHGIFIHHPKEREYHGMDVSIYNFIEY
jgi:hypothetical protein